MLSQRPSFGRTFLSHFALAFAQCTQAMGIRSVGESIMDYSMVFCGLYWYRVSVLRQTHLKYLAADRCTCSSVNENRGVLCFLHPLLDTMNTVVDGEGSTLEGSASEGGRWQWRWDGGN
jgi:hypothetical protein